MLRGKTPMKNSYISSSIKAILSGGAAKDGVAKRNPFARHEGRCEKTQEKLRFPSGPGNRFARNDGRCAKTEVFKLHF